ncbi:hypothetical protein AB0I82_35215 [Streptomyces sp. NPDC050315]|uniref:hypothetical protein n=1 Tax=Streptomyces sp. NPDC050315 TaxID=3155039 RepID=UPI003429913E
MNTYDNSAWAARTFRPPEAPTVPHPLRTRRLDLEMDEGARRLTVLERDYISLQRAYEEQSARLAQLERRLDTFMAAQTHEREDVASNDHSTHHVLAGEYDALVEQKVQGLARAAVPTFHGSVPGGTPTALWLMSQISAVLFGPDEPDTAGVLRALGKGRLDRLASQAARLCEAALNLRRRSAQTRLLHEWDFELFPGEPLDEQWQQAWPSCDRTLPGQFVIAPAYVVAEQVYSLQRVYTDHSLN